MVRPLIILLYYVLFIQDMHRTGMKSLERYLGSKDISRIYTQLLDFILREGVSSPA